MKFQTPLISATLVKRYKRFLFDAVLSDGREITGHCPNPGPMTGLTQPGSKIWLEPNDDPKKKLKYGWRLNELHDGHWAGIDANIPNRLVAEALAQKKIPEVAAYPNVRPEVKYAENSRIDFLLTGDGMPDFYLEVKNVNFMRTPGLVEFPDCRTERGAKHMLNLADVAKAGHKAAVLYVVQYTDCDRFSIAADLDPVYAENAKTAHDCGVEAFAYGTNISTDEITLGAPIRVE